MEFITTLSKLNSPILDKIWGFLVNTFGELNFLIENFSEFAGDGWKYLVMWVIGGVLIYLAIRHDMEPTLLLPMGFGTILVNIPLSGAITQIIDNEKVEGALSTLCTRLCVREEFPHEIGLFLGYPLGDVVGFMEHKGKNCLCCGCWKAYTDACAAKRQFDRFNKCTCVYRRLYGEGRPLTKLAVPS